MSDFNDTAQRALGRAAKDLLSNPLVTDSVGALMQARERAVAVQEVVLSQLNLPTAGDVERLTRRVRSVGQRLEGIEDSLDDLTASRIDRRLTAIEKQLEEISAALAVRA